MSPLQKNATFFFVAPHQQSASRYRSVSRWQAYASASALLELGGGQLQADLTRLVLRAFALHDRKREGRSTSPTILEVSEVRTVSIHTYEYASTTEHRPLYRRDITVRVLLKERALFNGNFWSPYLYLTLKKVWLKWTVIVRGKSQKEGPLKIASPDFLRVMNSWIWLCISNELGEFLRAIILYQYSNRPL